MSNENESVPVTQLKVYSKEGTLISTLELKDASYVIGRGEDCDIQCEGAANVSRHHAELTIRDGEAFIKDLNSTVGVMVNSKVVQASPLVTGDVIQLGMMKFIIELPPKQKKTDGAKSIVLNAVTEDAAAHMEQDLALISGRCAEIRAEVGKVIVGQSETVEGILAALLCQGHCLLIGVPGLAKTVMVCTFAKVLGLDTQRIQFTPDLMPSDIIGSEILKKNSDGIPELQFNQGPIFTQLLLADEINRTPPKTQAALLEAMQERQVTLGETTYRLPDPFLVLATQNPIDQEGTYQLPEAQLDRFLFKVLVTYPTREEELQVLDLMASSAKPPETSPVTTPEQVAASRDLVNQIYIDDAVRGYIVDLVRATRFPETVDVKLRGLIRAGASPRATINLALAARANAFMHHRSFVTPQDIKDLAHDILRHRILLSYEAEAENISTDDVIDHILTKVPVP